MQKTSLFLRRLTRLLLDGIFFGMSFFVMLAISAAICFSAYSGWYIIHNVDRIMDEMIRISSKLDASSDRLDVHAEALRRKANRIKND